MPDSVEEQLRAENENLKQAIANTWRPEVSALRDENERLRDDLNGHKKLIVDLDAEINPLKAENERLRAKFREQITEENAAYQELHRDNQRLRQLLGTISELLETFNPDA